MNAKIREHLEAHCKKNGWDTDDDSIKDVLLGSVEIYREDMGSHRWYDDIFVVVEIDGMLIGYDSYHTTGDNSWTDMDLEFQWDSVCEVEEKERVQKYYEKKVEPEQK